MKFLFFATFFILQNSWANELKLYVITPRVLIDWTSPNTLAVTTAANSVSDDYAPIGHFAVELNCEYKSRYGVKHLLTGMERKNKKESQQITMKKKLGLGSLIYSFKGQLQSSTSSAKEIAQAMYDKRLKIIKIPTTANRCLQMLGFIEEWIKWGSYQVYGGNKKAATGEGAGCADFAMEFFKMATNRPVPKEWLVQIKVPSHLIGDGKGKEVPFTEILKSFSWGTSRYDLNYEIADTNKVDLWLPKHLKKINGVYIYDRHLEHSDLLDNYQRSPMTYFYNVSLSPEWLWKTIKVER